MKKNKAIRQYEFYRIVLGPTFFCILLIVLCISIIVFIPKDDANLSNQTIVTKDLQDDITEYPLEEIELETVKQVKNLVKKTISIPPVSFQTVVEERAQKDDEILAFYRSFQYRAVVVWFFSQITQNSEVTMAILENADKNGIPVSLAFALAFTESRFNVEAVNTNKNGSSDYGLFQLNSKSFPKMTQESFFDPYINAQNGLSYLRFCLDTAGNDVAALAMYNAGTNRVRGNSTPQSTLNYVSTIIDYRNGIEELFNSQVAAFYKADPYRSSSVAMAE